MLWNHRASWQKLLLPIGAAGRSPAYPENWSGLREVDPKVSMIISVICEYGSVLKRLFTTTDEMASTPASEAAYLPGVDILLLNHRVC